MDQLMVTLNSSPNVRAIQVKGNVLRDWDAYLEIFYNGFKGGTIKQSHVFRMWDSTHKLKMDILESVREGDKGVQCDFLRIQKYGKTRADNQYIFCGTCVDQDDDWCFVFCGENHRIDALKNTEPTKTVVKGVPDIKKCELYTKWRVLMPDERTADMMCPHPGDDILSQDKQNKKEKMKMKMKQMGAKKKGSKETEIMP